MIKEDYVSVHTAKLLKEKGFDEFCDYEYGIPNIDKGYVLQLFFRKIKNSELIDSAYTAPTLQIVIKWIQETHNIIIVADYEYECTDTSWYYKIYRLGENGKPERVPVIGVSYDKDDTAHEHIVGYRDYERSKEEYVRREEAEEAGIIYCLENLI